MYRYLWLCVIIFAPLLGLNFGEGPNNRVSAVKQQYQSDRMAFAEKIQNQLALVTRKAPAEEILKGHLELRLQFKRFEHLIAHLDEEGTKDFLNGAPLLQIERNAPELRILEPEGLQVLDELVVEEQLDYAQMQSLLKSLQHHFEDLHRSQQRVYFSDRLVLEAMRSQLLRMMSLGLTGFDTPGSLNALPEAEASLQRLAEQAALYYTPLRQIGKGILAAQCEQQFAEALDYLAEHQDFNTFDRLHFIREWLNLLYGLLLDIHLQLGIETIEEVSINHVAALNYQEADMFGPDLLNPYHFMRLSEREDNATRSELGRLLFFDPLLSSNNERACASCHQPHLAFTDGRAKSMALNFEGTVKRNAPTLLNSVFADRYFHDLRADFLESQAEHVIFNEKEFATNYQEIAKKLGQSEEYRQLFKAAFPTMGERNISRYSIVSALASYVKTLRSHNSPFDRYIRGEQEAFPEAAKRGFNLFMGKAACGTCHFAPTFAGTVPPSFDESEGEVLGVPVHPDSLRLDGDLGRMASGRPKEAAEHYKHAFKTPTVRNIALTAPYMHNGAYATLEQVMDFYNKGGGAGIGIPVSNQTLAPDALNLNEQEIADIIVFMQQLSDTTGTQHAPVALPKTGNADWDKRVVGGKY